MALQNVDAFYPLTPMQQGMLFHSISAADPEMYCQQLACTLDGPLDPDAFSRAWQEAVDGHGILRTSFVWQGAKEPVQVVQRRAEIPFTYLDWREATAEEQERRLEDFVFADRRKGFDLGRPPLTRVALVRTGHERHELLWTHHHVLLDGTSVNRIIKEVFGRYEALIGNRTFAADEPPPFKEYVRWLRRQDLTAAEAYWRELLEGFSNPTPIVERLPGGRPGATSAVATETMRLAADVYPAAVAFARSSRITVNTVFQAAWALLLGRYSGEEDVVFGATVSGRPHDLPGADAMVGIFINTLPVRASLGYEQPLIPWLQALQAQQARSRRFEFTPLFEAQRWSGVAGDRPLFQSILAFANYHVDEASWKTDGSLRIGAFRPWESSSYPLNVYVEPGPDCTLGLVYQQDVLTADAARRMLGHWGTLLAAMAGGHHERLGELPMLTPSEREQILVRWNDTESDFPISALTHELVAEHAARSPDAPAVSDAGVTLTYQELDRRANRLARYLADLGIGRGDSVAVCLERSAELLVALLGVLKTGAAYVPLDPEYPLERVSFMVEDSGARVLLSRRHLHPDMSTGSARRIDLDVQDREIAERPDMAPQSEVEPDDVAYMIYTSGSTGLPKGTCITHRSLLNLVFWHRREFEVTAPDRASQIAGPAFDALGWEVWPYLTCGASVHVASSHVVAAPEGLRDWLVEEAISIAFVPTPLAERLIGLDWQEDVALRSLLTGGDVLHRAPGPSLPFPVVNNYGPTESTVVTTSCRIEPTGEVQALPPIGRPIANTQVYLLDRHMRPVPVGVPGELHVAGAGLAVGYHRRPELTAERFVPNPFSDEDGARLYRTGDLARHRPDGRIDFLGRIDFQVKLRGFRIELGEIEAVLARHPGVGEAVVVASGSGEEDRRLIAYVVAESPKPKVSELRAGLREKLPEYMVPAAFVWMEELPLTPNGKVDRGALPAPEGGRLDTGTAYVAPESAVERTIAAVWSEVLGIDRVGRHDNFFDLGGHSMLLTRAFGRLQGSFDRELNIVDLFTYPTVSALAAFVVGDGAAPDARAGVDRAAVRRAAIQRRRPVGRTTRQGREDGGATP